MGASWNTAAMVMNIKMPNNQWQLLPFVHNYDGLMETLRKNGYDYGGSDPQSFLWAYDWRDRLSVMSAELDTFINKKVKMDEKVELVGHSLGGLVARIWYQSHTNDPRIDSLITLGSPHQGDIKSYEFWASGLVPSDWGAKAVAMNILMETQKAMYLTTTNMVRTVVPSLRDINPTFDFIKNNQGIVAWSKTSGANDYLDTENALLNSSIVSKVDTIVAHGPETKRFMITQEPSIIDKGLMRWPDGKPSSYVYDAGDGSVLDISAQLSGATVGRVSALHTDMVDPSIPHILDYLNIPSNYISQSPPSITDGSLVFFIGSPAYLEVLCDSLPLQRSDAMGFVVVANARNTKCQEKVVGTGSGTYHLVSGVVGSSSDWHYSEGSITNGAIEYYTVTVADGNLSVLTSSDQSYDLIMHDIALLKTNPLFRSNRYLQNAERSFGRKNIDELLDSIFEFRKKTGEFQISDRIIENSTTILTLKFKNSSRGMAKAMLMAANINHRFVKMRLALLTSGHRSLSIRRAHSYELSEYYFNQLQRNYNSENYSGVVAITQVIESLLREI